MSWIRLCGQWKNYDNFAHRYCYWSSRCHSKCATLSNDSIAQVGYRRAKCATLIYCSSGRVTSRATRRTRSAITCCASGTRPFTTRRHLSATPAVSSTRRRPCGYSTVVPMPRANRSFLIWRTWRLHPDRAPFRHRVWSRSAPFASSRYRNATRSFTGPSRTALRCRRCRSGHLLRHP